MNSETETSDVKPEEENQTQIADLETRMSNVDVSFKVIGKGEAREVTSRRDGSINRVADAIVGDESGVVTLSLWNDMIDRLETGKTYLLKKGYTGLFRGNLRLKIGRESEVAESSKEISEVNMDNDLTAIDHGRPRRRHYYQGYSGGFYGRGRSEFRSSYRDQSSRRDNRRRRRSRY